MSARYYVIPLPGACLIIFPEMVHLVLSLKEYEQERANKAHESDKTVLKQ